MGKLAAGGRVADIVEWRLSTLLCHTTYELGMSTCQCRGRPIKYFCGGKTKKKSLSPEESFGERITSWM